MQSRKQVKQVYQIGLSIRPFDVDLIEFTESIATAASRVCGGCTISEKTGYWMDDGAEKKATFDGKLEHETCIELELTCELAKANEAYTHMVQSITIAAMQHGIETDWVHVSEIEMEGRHFSVKAELDRMQGFAA